MALLALKELTSITPDELIILLLLKLFSNHNHLEHDTNAINNDSLTNITLVICIGNRMDESAILE